MNRFRIRKAWWAVLLFTISVLTPLFNLVPAPAAAASGYKYTGSNYASISGPNPVGSGSVTFDKTSGGVYQWQTSTPSGGRGASAGRVCQATITTNDGAYDGDGNGTLRNTCDSSQDTPIQIAGGKASITKNGTWTDHNHISDNSDNLIFVDGKIDDNLNFTISTQTDNGGAADSCQQKSFIAGFPHSGSGGDGKNTANATALVYLHMYNTSSAVGDNQCLETTYPMQLSDPYGGFASYFIWGDAGTIGTSDGTTMIFSQGQGASASGKYLDTSGGQCQSYITADPNNLASDAKGTLVIQSTSDSNPLHAGFPDGKDGDKSGQHVGDASLHKSGGCYVSDPIKVNLANPTVNGSPASTAAAGSSEMGSDVASSNSDDSTLNCHAGFNPLNWVVCAMVKGMVGIIGTLDDAITQELAVGTDSNSATPDEPTKIFCDSGTCDGYYKAWASFRNIALGLTVIAGLLIVISQAIGMEILDAYTVRKTLPRILLALVGISLSWPLMAFMVTLTNDLGFGMRYLIYHPFASTIHNSFSLSLGQDMGTALVALVAYQPLGIFGLLTYAGTGALAVFVAFVVLVLRQIAIVVLIIFAPIAIIAYVLPNTQRVYKFWWDSFIKALFMFPLITAFIAAGRVFSLISLSEGTGILPRTIGFAAYFAPYFLIPATFRLAGGALRQIGGFVNDRSRGGFDVLRNARKNRTADRMKRMRSGGLYDKDFLTIGKSGKYSLGKGLNMLNDWTWDADEKGVNFFGNLGVPLLGRTARQQNAEIQDETFKHSGNLAQKIGGGHQMGWTLAHQFDKFAGTRSVDRDTGEVTWSGGAGMSNEARQRLVDNFGTINDDGSVSWRGARTEGQLFELQSILGMEGAGKDTAYASERLGRAIPTIVRHMRHEDTRRADWETTGAILAAQKGRLEDTDERDLFNQAVAEKGESFAVQRQEMLEQVQAQHRPEMRDGHVLKVERDAQGQLNARAILSDMPESHEANSNLGGIAGSTLNGARAETVRSARRTILRRAGQGREEAELSAEQLSERRTVITNATSPYNNADQRREWLSIAADLGMDTKNLSPRQADGHELMDHHEAADDGGGGH